MAHKQLMFRAAAREKILHGATLLADAIRVTLGPKSKCVLIEKKWGKPIVCNDGVTIAKEIVSVAGVLLLTEATLTEIPEEKESSQPAAGMPEV